MNPTKNIFINSCIRSKANQDLLQSNSIKTLGYAIGYLLAEEFEISCPILIATDTRPSGQEIKKALIQGLLDFGHDVFDAGISPTPFVAKALKDYQGDEDADDAATEDDESFFMLGIVITASHNPAEYNGIKILTPFGYLDIATEEEISDIFHTFTQNPKLIQESLPDEAGMLLDFDLASWYQSEILQTIQQPTHKISVLLDCANGATAEIASRIFTACGFNVATINNSLDGTKINQNSGCSNQENLLLAMKKYNTLWGCAFDGDGDRVIIVHQDGTIFDGDDVIAVLSHHEKYQATPIIVGTIMTNQAVQIYFAKHHKKLIRTQVGERNIIEELIKHQAFLGAETCGHITMMDHAFCSDGIFAALMFFETIATNHKLINKPYQKYAQVHESIPLNNIKLNNLEIKKIVTEFEKNYTSRIVVRPSNTEPILRIMVENTDEHTAITILEKLIKRLKNI